MRNINLVLIILLDAELRLLYQEGRDFCCCLDELNHDGLGDEINLRQ
jgi:hypothetical protein